jgi:hypothetical protein
MFTITQANVSAIITVWVVSIWLLLLMDYGATKQRPDVVTMVIIVIGGPILLIAFGVWCWYEWYIERNQSPYRKQK